MKTIKVYVDTSIIGGIFDSEFATATKIFFDQVTEGRFHLVISALATVNNCPIIVSWNFKHIVHFEKIPLYNSINLINGYQPIAIYSPLEVLRYE
jgi:hypothetical protein